MSDIKIYNQKDLMLKVRTNYNPSKLDLTEWENYLDILCGNREYQKESIKSAIIFMASGLYNSTEDLARENFQNNVNLQQKYTTLEKFLNSLQIKNKYHANIDLATGSGKSYVIYGIAQIMLALGLVKRVLVLCPSLTIEKGLTEKFNNLASDSNLRDSIPNHAVIRNPSITNANNTIVEGDICVENIHAVYETTGSSIRDSFKHGGHDTLVLNDESHHIYNELQSISGRSTEGKNIKKWKEFLLSPDINFQYIIGFTGTAYIDNEYFTDVIYRYSLREAIDDRVVKSIEYVQEDDSKDDKYRKFQKIYQNHFENKRKNKNLKALSIMITKDIPNAKVLYEELCEFLSEWESLPLTEIKKKVLIVTSATEHAPNVTMLDYVDNRDNLVEWIISVSMLTEGWDVKNVFQIVPWEDRAFNSKLLIAQVLGRGLRIPESYSGMQPSVIVFNHASWSKNIKGLVDEVLEIETRIVSSVKFMGDRNKYHFVLYNIRYDKKETETEHPEVDKPLNYSKAWDEGITLVSQPESLTMETTYENLSTNTPLLRRYNIKYRTRSINDVTNKILREFRIRDLEGGIFGLGDNEIYNKNNLPGPEKINSLIRRSMDAVGIKGNDLSEDNANRIMRAFDTLFRRSSKTVVFEKNPDNLFKINTEDIENESIGLSSLRRGATVFYTGDFENIVINEEQFNIMDEFLKDETFPRSSSYKIDNEFFFKTPMNIVFTRESPENEFTKKLCERDNSKNIISWIKSRDRGFYQIEYSYQLSTHHKQKTFNPDYFIKCNYGEENVILVVEIKTDDDDSIENKAKYKYALKHFEELNQKLQERGIKERYIFHFLSPKDYQTFFQYIENEKIFRNEFRGSLEALLEESEIQ